MYLFNIRVGERIVGNNVQLIGTVFDKLWVLNTHSAKLTIWKTGADPEWRNENLLGMHTGNPNYDIVIHVTIVINKIQA